MKVIEVSVDKITPLMWNPETRITEANLGRLKDSIKKFGILQPLLTTDDFRLIDGHRRLACAKALGIQTVWCAITEAEDVGLCYVEANDSTRAIKPKDWLNAFVHGGTVPKDKMKRIVSLQKVIGDEGLQRLADLGISPSLYGLACHVAAYCNARPEIGDIIMWLADFNQSFVARAATKMRVAPSVIMAAVRDHRPLTLA